METLPTPLQEDSHANMVQVNALAMHMNYVCNTSWRMILELLRRVPLLPRLGRIFFAWSRKVPFFKFAFDSIYTH